MIILLYMLTRKQGCQQIEHSSLQKTHSKEMVAQQDYYSVWIENKLWMVMIFLLFI